MILTKDDIGRWVLFQDHTRMAQLGRVEDIDQALCIAGVQADPLDSEDTGWRQVDFVNVLDYVDCSMPANCELVDAQAMHVLHPKTFDVPADAELAGLRAGDMVKLVVQFRHPEQGIGGERMWFRIVEANADKLMVRLDNDPVVVPMQWGRLIHCERRHVLDVILYEHRQMYKPAGVGIASGQNDSSTRVPRPRTH